MRISSTYLKSQRKALSSTLHRIPHSQPYFDIIEIKKRITVLEEKEVHLVKKVSKELGLTYKELAEEIGYSEGNLRKSVYQNRLSLPVKKAIELYLEVTEFRENEKSIKEMKNRLKSLLNQSISEIST